jgi:hypothetical protein
LFAKIKALGKRSRCGELFRGDDWNETYEEILKYVAPAIRVEHPEAPALRQNTGFAHPTRQNGESHCGSKNKYGQTCKTKCCKHQALKSDRTSNICPAQQFVSHKQSRRNSSGFTCCLARIYRSVPSKPAKIRPDQLLVARDLADSLPKTQAMILAGEVSLNEVRLDKPCTAAQDAQLTIASRNQKYAARAINELSPSPK